MGDLASLSLTDLIIKTGIHDAIARKLNEKGKLSKNAIAEGIINNVRKTIIRDQLTDPRFYKEMSMLLDDLIKQSRIDTAAYEKFLRDAEVLVRRIAERGYAEGVPAVLHGNEEAAVIFRNLPNILAQAGGARFAAREGGASEAHAMAQLAIRIDQAMLDHAPAGWRGDQAREAEVQNTLNRLVNYDRAATIALFDLIKKQSAYP